MPSLDFLLQGLDETNDHFAALDRLLDLPDIKQCLISVAFMNAAGAGMAAEKLARLADRLQLFVGIRNGITSKQSIDILRAKNIYPICVDTATQAFIFHPKVYIAQNPNLATMITGSANFTAGGLVKNIEASLIVNLDLSCSKDAALAIKVFTDFEALRSQHPDNVFQLNDTHDLDEMVRQGLLEDETAQAQRATARATSDQNRADRRRRMNIRTRRLGASRRSRAQQPANVSVPQSTASFSAITNNQLLWKSGPLTRRDLNIPTGSNTNPTGSMLLKVGDPSQNIDQRHYFRDVVFAGSAWNADSDPRRNHIERCMVKFKIIIKGIDYGVHELMLSHNTRTDTATYRQNNSMTQIHWGSLKPIVAQEDLLDGILCIYTPDEGSNSYTLAFDVE